jgi:hypothetical protein
LPSGQPEHENFQPILTHQLRTLVYRIENAGHSKTPGLVLMNSLVEGYRLFLPELDPCKMPPSGIDVTLTSCFTGVVISFATLCDATTACAFGSVA